MEGQGCKSPSGPGNLQASTSRWPRLFFFSCNVFQVITGSTHLVSEFKTQMGLHCQDPSKHYQVFQG